MVYGPQYEPVQNRMEATHRNHFGEYISKIPKNRHGNKYDVCIHFGGFMIPKIGALSQNITATNPVHSGIPIKEIILLVLGIKSRQLHVNLTGK